MADFLNMPVVKVFYGEVMTEEELLRTIVRARRENATSLDLSGNQLTTLPGSIGQLANLQILDLRNTQLKRLSEAIGQLTNLRELYLYGNQLTSLPEAIGQLQYLEVLGLSDNHLMSLPTAIGRLTELRILFLSGNRLTAIPAAVGRLEKLIRLSLSENALTEIPSEIGQMKNLQRLDLVANQLVRLPDSIGELTNLQYLYLANNRLQILPLSLRKLTDLQELDTAGNPLSLLPPASLPSPPHQPENSEQRVSFAHKLAGVVPTPPATAASPSSPVRSPLPIAPVTATQEVKILVVGQSNTGKTSLIKRLIHNQFDLNELPTNGVSLEKWSVNVAVGETPNFPAVTIGCCHLWDLGGSNHLHAAHQNLMTDRSLYLLVIDNNESDEQNRIEYWLKLINSSAAEVMVVIVANKSDRASLDIDQHHYRQQYPNISGFFAVSCQDATGIPELSQHILQTITNFPHVRTPLPADWLQVKTKLENLNKSHLTYAEYGQICGDSQVVDAVAQQSLLKLLHDLGIVLNLDAGPLLSNTPIWNPGWIVHGIYKILTDRAVAIDCRGVVAEQMLTRILTPFQCNKMEFAYSVTKHRLILEMIRRLELCSEITGRRSFILPNLLPQEAPAAAALELWSGALQFQYRYPVFPPGLITRLLTRCGAAIDGDGYWRDGLILQSLENRALVVSDRLAKTITLSVLGAPDTCGDFLGMLRQELTAIHQTLGAFEVEAYVPLPDFPAVMVSYQQLLDSLAEGVDVMVPQGLRQRVNVRELLEMVDGSPALAPLLPTNGRKAVANGDWQQPYSSPHLYLVNNQVLAENPYPTVTAEQLREVQEIALRLVQGEMVAGEVDLLSAHLRAPLADAVQYLLTVPGGTAESSDLWS